MNPTAGNLQQMFSTRTPRPRRFNICCGICKLQRTQATSIAGQGFLRIICYLQSPIHLPRICVQSIKHRWEFSRRRLFAVIKFEAVTRKHLKHTHCKHQSPRSSIKHTRWSPARTGKRRSFWTTLGSLPSDRDKSLNLLIKALLPRLFVFCVDFLTR